MVAVGAVPLDAGDVDARLARFALSVGELHSRVVLPAYKLSGSVTSFHPRSERGRVFYAEATAGLRRVCAARGWRCDDTDGVARAVSPAGDLVVVAATGNEFTGDPRADAAVTTMFDHGPKLLDGVVAEPGYTFDEIIPEAFPFPRFVPAPPSREVWLLLLHRAGGEVRIELSRPTGRDISGFPRLFAKRIIVPSLLTGDTDVADDFDPGDGNIDVPVLGR